MYAYLRNAMGSLTAPAASPTAANAVDQESANEVPSDPTSSDRAGRAPYPTRMRVILILSLMSWMMIALTIAWAMRFM